MFWFFTENGENYHFKIHPVFSTNISWHKGHHIILKQLSFLHHHTAVFYDSCPTKSLDNYLITNCMYIPQDLPQHKSLPVNTLYHFCCSLSKHRTIYYQLKLLIECLCIRPYYTCWGYRCSYLHCMLLYLLFFNPVTLGRFKDTVCMYTPKKAYILTSVSTEVWFMVK